MRGIHFGWTIHYIRRHIELIRNHYVKITKQQQGFISLCHDIADAKSKEILGLTVVYICPLSGMYFLVPVGVIAAKGKKASVVAEQSCKILRRFGITESDMYRPVNDNTNSALAAGRLITGKDESGHCGMHHAELVLKHATGQARRVRRRKVIDHFDEMEAFRKKVKKAATWLVTKQFKSRYASYASFVQNQLLYTPIRIVVGNDTRVAGFTIMLQHML